MKNITFAYFSEAIKALDADTLFEEFSTSTILDTKNRIIIDLDNNNIIIGAKQITNKLDEKKD